MRFGYFTRWFPSVLVALGISTLALSPAHVSGIVVIEDGAVSKGGHWERLPKRWEVAAGA